MNLVIDFFKRTFGEINRGTSPIIINYYYTSPIIIIFPSSKAISLISGINDSLTISNAANSGRYIDMLPIAAGMAGRRLYSIPSNTSANAASRYGVAVGVTTSQIVKQSCPPVPRACN